MVDVKCLSDWELQHRLEKLGFSPGPILPSTRSVYEKKLVQLLISPSCTPPVMDGPRKLGEPQDSDDSEGTDSEECNVILKGNTTLSTEKSKESKKRPKTSATRTRGAEICCLGHKPSKGKRCAARARNTRNKRGIVTKERCRCASNQSVDSGFPAGVRLAILGILIIVLFVYVTMEKKPLFG